MRKPVLLIVSASLVLSAGAIAVVLVGGSGTSPQPGAAVLEEMRALHSGALQYQSELGHCPTSVTDMVVEGFADGALDPWGHVYRVSCDGGMAIESSGPDGVPNTPDDHRIPAS